MKFSLVKAAFRACPRFQGLDENSLALLYWHAEEKTFRAGERIYEEGTKSDNTFAMLAKGELSILRSSEQIRRISPFEVFGEVGYFKRRKLRSSTVEVASPTATCLVFRIHPKALKAGPFVELRKRLSTQAWVTFVQDTQREL